MNSEPLDNIVFYMSKLLTSSPLRVLWFVYTPEQEYMIHLGDRFSECV